LAKLSELYPNGNLPLNIKTDESSDKAVKNILYYLSASKELKEHIGIKMRQTIEQELKRREVFIGFVLDYSPVIKQEFYQKFSQLAFKLYQTYGFPYELTQEMAKEKGARLDQKIFCQAFAKHQEKSRIGAQAKFAGGLADQTQEAKKLHTATHLLQQALRNILGDHIGQKGSNITKDRLRFDFSHPQALSLDEIKQVEDLVNQKIKQALPVRIKEMDLERAKQAGAIGLFPEKYQAKVKVYSIGDFSREICGGPHVKNTKELGSFKIIKQESSSAGVRRIKAVLK
jgi:alanyl-tRNA synthetase